MCGICGFVGFKDDELIRKMTKMLVHRGPDSEGYFSDTDVTLGVRRLAIIDLATGNQPVYNENKSIVVIFNGEIYNFVELRAELESKGHKFCTKTDTEVIVHLYEEYKESCVEHLYGMFAFAVWDTEKKQLFLARDRLGIKPLYYAIIDGNLIFASEIKSILCCHNVSKEINIAALDQYLTFLYIPSPQTIFNNIYQLPQAHYLVYRQKKIEIKNYWNLRFNKTQYSENYYLEKLDDILKKVVKQHLISDVPVGVFLSGGRDSSTICSYACKVLNKNVNTFTIGYSSKEKSFNELNKAKIVSQLLNTNHFEYIVEPEIVNELLRKLPLFFDQPFADSSSVVTYLISKLTKEKLTVALTGIGGDELFCGYPRYLGMKFARLFPKIRVSTKLLNKIPENYSSDNITGRVKRFLFGLSFSEVDRYISFVSYLYNEDKQQFYSTEFKDVLKNYSCYDVHKKYFESVLNEELLDRIMFVDINTYLVDDLLYMGDRMSMANSIELRVPFCDHRIVEFAAEIPASLKIKGFTLKYLLRKLLERYFPKEIVAQKKMGFMIPLGRWLSDVFYTQVSEFIKKEEYKDYFNYEFIKNMWQQHVSRKKNFADQIWSLLIFDTWKKIYDIHLPSLKEKYKPFKRKLKILMVSDFIFEDEEGGSSRMVSEISNELAKRGHKIFNLTMLRKKGYPLYQTINSREIYRYKSYPYNLLLSYLQVRKIITQFLGEINFDIVNYHHPFSGFLVKNVKKIKNIPQVYYFYSPWHVEYEIRAKNKNFPKVFYKINSYLRKKLEVDVVNSCKKVILLSEYTKRLIKEYHKILDEKICLIPGGVDIQKFSPKEDRVSIRKELQLPVDKKILLTVRNLVPRMGLENLLFAFRDLIRDDKNLFLVICGSGFLEEKLKLLTRELGLDNFVKFTGFVPDEILPKYYQSADLFVLPTKELEGFGLVTIESLSCGTPVLGTPVGGTVEILSKLDLLFEDNAPQAMVKKIKEFLKIDKEKFADISKKCRQYVVENFSWKKVVDKIEELFLILVNK
ncbi:MAG: asparagine synthase (glutamine-hydrolyzing) [Endomicrobiia bacterium]